MAKAATEISQVDKLEALKLYYIEEKSPEIIAEMPLFKDKVAWRTIYKWAENGELLLKFIENLDPFAIKYLIKNGKTNAAFMKLLLENYMGKVATQKSEIAIKGLADVLKDTITEANK